MERSLAYCPDLGARLERLRALCSERPQDRVFARMSVETNAFEEVRGPVSAGLHRLPGPGATRAILG